MDSSSTSKFEVSSSGNGEVFEITVFMVLASVKNQYCSQHCSQQFEMLMVQTRMTVPQMVVTLHCRTISGTKRYENYPHAS